MKAHLLPLFLACALVGCSDDDASTPATTTDSAFYGDGPTTTRPDDGVDTSTATDTGAATDATSDDAATDAASTDATSSDATSSDAADAG